MKNTQHQQFVTTTREEKKAIKIFCGAEYHHDGQIQQINKFYK